MLLAVASCTGLKNVPKDEVLYTGAKVQIIVNKGTDIKGKGKVKEEVQEAIKVKPNSKFLGMRPGLWLYYTVKKPARKEKGLRNWLKYKMGQAPVYMSGVDIPLTARGIDAKLYNTGFLDSYSQYEIKQGHKGKTASVLYTINLRKPFTIESIEVPSDSSDISKAIARTNKRTRIKVGDRYSLEKLVEERARIENSLKRRGYYYFNQDHIIFAMDTSFGDRKVRLSMSLKRDMPE